MRAILLLFLFSCLLGQEHEFKGTHYLASYKQCDQQALLQVDLLEKVMIQAANASGATVLDSSVHFFDQGGFTMVILLSESHASIHTYPEFCSCFVDLFTCGDNCLYQNFEAILKNYLQPKQIKTQTMRRQ
jgi:S-adenosylmethionine decarboxylase